MLDKVRFGSFDVDLAAGQLRKAGVRLNLRDKSFQVLTALLENPGEVVTREDLRRRLWPEDVFVDFDNNLNTAIARLREVLCDSAEQPRFIETLPRRGYRFMARVVAEQATPSRLKLVVLPFMNSSGDPAEEYFSDAMTDEIITALAGLAPDRLAVIARTTAMHYKGSHQDVAGIGRELGVQYVVEGGVRRTNGRVGMNVQLIQVSDQTHLFAREFDAEMSEIFNLQRQVARAIAEHIPGVAGCVGISAPRVRRKPTSDLGAYNLYLQGRYHMYLAPPEGLGKAKQMFEAAIARDPSFALAYDALAEVYWWTGFMGFIRPRDGFYAGMFPAMRSIEIDGTAAEAHALLGQFRKEFDYNWTEVEREMNLALKLDPMSPIVHWRNSGSNLMAQGKLPAAIEELQFALELDPMDLNMQSWLGVLYWLGGENDRAVAQAHFVLDINPNYPLAYLMLGQALCMLRRFDESLAAIRRALEIYGGAPVVLCWLGLALAQSGNVGEARALLDRLHAAEPGSYVPATSFAWTHLGLNEIDEAFQWMDRAIDERDPMMVPIKTYPFLDPLRLDRRFQALLRKMNLAA